MSITAIILAHFKERENNLVKIVADLRSGTIPPDEIVIFIDNKDIEYKDRGVRVIKSTHPFLPKIRFSLGTYFDTDYCFFIDDDATVRPKTLENFLTYAHPDKILGYQGSILNRNHKEPYTHDTPINRGDKLVEVDVIIRTYFVPTKLLGYGLIIQAIHPELPKTSLDDVYLCMGAKYLGGGESWVIPVDESNDTSDLDEAGVGQSYNNADHYLHRNITCRYLLDKYEGK